MVLAIIVGDDAPLVLRVSDDALVSQRWKTHGRHAHDDARVARNRYWMSCAKAERLAAAALGAPHPQARHARVREMLDSNTTEVLGAIDDATVVALTERLEDATLDALVAAVHDHPGMHVRLHGAALEHLDAFARTPLSRLTLSKPMLPSAPCPAVEELTVIGAAECSQLADAFPNLRRLALDANGTALTVAPLRALEHLRTLEIGAAAVTDADRFASLTTLDALRISRVTGIRVADALASLPLRVLALEHLHELERLDALASMSSLEQLELLGLWQFDIGDVEWTLALPRLTRCEVDIGGRRKNVELYKRSSWAYPWPFPGTSMP